VNETVLSGSPKPKLPPVPASTHAFPLQRNAPAVPDCQAPLPEGQAGQIWYSSPPADRVRTFTHTREIKRGNFPPRNQVWKITSRRTLLRFLWCEAAIYAVRRDPELKRFYRRKLQQKRLGKARVAAARKLGIRLWIMLRDQIDYQEFCRRGQMRQKSGSVRAGLRWGVVLRYSDQQTD